MIEKIIETAFYGFWHFIGAFIILYAILSIVANTLVRSWSRFLRMIMVMRRGWPPAHLDADGDPIFKIK